MNIVFFSTKKWKGKNPTSSRKIVNFHFNQSATNEWIDIVMYVRKQLKLNPQLKISKV